MVSLIFVPKTDDGELSKRIRTAARRISDITGDHCKVVERSGIKLKHLLHKSNPWQNIKCGREKCLVCNCALNKKFNWRLRSVTYKMFCLKCDEERKKTKEDLDKSDDNEDSLEDETKFYFGESSKTSFERGVLHAEDYVKKKDDSHMWKHVTDAHSDSDPKDVKFGMTVLRSHPSPFHRQVTESVLIYRNQNNLNSKSMMMSSLIQKFRTLMKEVIRNQRKNLKQCLQIYFQFLLQLQSLKMPLGK